MSSRKRVAVKYFYDEQKQSKEIRDIHCGHYNIHSPSLKGVRYWNKELGSGRPDLHDISSPGRTPGECFVDVVAHKHE
jgi:hypothetical protein